MALRKNRFVVEAAASAGVTNVAGGRLVHALLEAIVREVSQGSEVRLAHFGSFVCVEAPHDRRRRVPVMRRVVKFRAGKRFQDALRP